MDETGAYAWTTSWSSGSTLRCVLTGYSTYYNAARMRIALGKDTPLRPTVMLSGRFRAVPFPGGLRHRYVWTA